MLFKYLYLNTEETDMTVKVRVTKKKTQTEGKVTKKNTVVKAKNPKKKR